MAVPNNQLHIDNYELMSKINPSLTSFFSVYILDAVFGEVKSDDINLYAYEAVLPGTSFELGQVFGDRQGITEQYPNKRMYPPIDVSFYINVGNVKSNTPYPAITFFENWMQSIFELKGVGGDKRYGRFNYPDTYEREIVITKFERDYRDSNARLSTTGTAGVPQIESKCTYTLRNAFPSNIISIPVSYSQADILRTTITFNYDFYSYQNVTYK
jgi:hypothetical protein